MINVDRIMESITDAESLHIIREALEEYKENHKDEKYNIQDIYSLKEE